MIKELEIRNTVESVNLGSLYPAYSYDAESPMITGYVSNEGQLMTIDVNREIAADRVRQLYCYFFRTSQAYRQAEYYLIEKSDFLFDPTLYNDPGGVVHTSSHNFDISTVLTLPREIYVIPTTNELVIELFTYEANITDATGQAIYGTKRLSVPYDATMDVTQDFPLSTDGLYPIGLVDYVTRNKNQANTTTFKKNDIVYWYEGPGAGDPTLEEVEDGALYKAAQDTTNSPDTEGHWDTTTDEDTLRYFLIPPAASTTESSTIVGANGLLSRYAKHTYMRDVLTRLSYKKYDDKTALYSSNILSSIRELAVNSLEEGDLVKSVYYLDRMVNEYNAFFTSDDVTQTRINAQYTL